MITITPKDGERYQGIVGLDQDSLAACIEEYFLQSEQLMTQVRLFAQQGEKPMAGGTLLQVLQVDLVFLCGLTNLGIFSPFLYGILT